MRTSEMMNLINVSWDLWVKVSIMSHLYWTEPCTTHTNHQSVMVSADFGQKMWYFALF